ncbi:NAD(P)H-hydrate dehydratase [Candidatus Bathyarchaeota archaeon]|nr:NAD(P)H-hydrate dehydratase [Candidatus Bathyarchaeota archaeon]
MKALELNAEYIGVSTLQLMENAGKAVAEEIYKRFKPNTKITVFCGTGRNGGDGLVAARHLASLGFKVSVNLIGKENDLKSSIVIKNWEAVKSMLWSIETHVLPDSSTIHPCESDVIIDALLGTGAKGLLKQPILQAVKAINESKGFKVAVDVPTGVDSDSGEILGDAVKVDLTITFHKPKFGLKKAEEFCGEIKVAEIGIPLEAELFAGPGDIELVKKPRSLEAHKGDFGRLLVIGGSETYIGAPAFVGLAALRVGVDLVYIASPEKTAYAISTISPNLITIKLFGNHLSLNNFGETQSLIKRVDAVVVGPGLGTHKETEEALKRIFNALNEFKKPFLIDADAIKTFGETKINLEAPVILTPHAGEFEKLTGVKPSSSIKERIEEVKEASKKFKAVILLKGYVDVISNGEKFKLNFTGNPGMTVGGTGDVLAGIAGAFLAQGTEPFKSAVAASFINGVAGDMAYLEKGYHIVSTDLIEKIPKAIDEASRLKFSFQGRLT